MASEQECTRERIAAFYERHREKGRAFTVKHFEFEGISRATVYRVLERGSTERKVGSGRPAKKIKGRRLETLKKTFLNRDDWSCRTAALKLGISKSYVSECVHKLGLSHYAKQKAPAYTPEQEQTVKLQAGRMYRKFVHTKIVMDNESYFTLSGSLKTGYYTDNKENAPNSVKYKQKRKFEPKVMLYVVISEEGISKPIFKVGGNAVNADTYVNECLAKALVPFLSAHHADGNYVFWPDKASSHYAKKATDYLKAHGIPYVEKAMNPTNLPQCRPVEDFFGYLAGIIYRGGWRAENTDQLQKRIRWAIRQVDMNVIRKMMSRVAQRLRTVSRQGVFAMAH